MRTLAALGANDVSRRRLARGMMRANLRRMHKGWAKVADSVLPGETVRVDLNLPSFAPRSGTSEGARSAGAAFNYRPGTTDLLVLEQIFLDGEYDFGLIDPAEVKYILDFGSNIGVTAMLWARRFPEARMVLVEPDPENFAMLARNIEPFKERCLLLNAAVANENGEGVFYKSAREYGHSVVPQGDSVGEVRVRLLTVEAIGELAGFPRIDLIKMDIEGGESLVMPTISSWGSRTRYLVAELHPPYGAESFRAHCRTAGLEIVQDHGVRGEPHLVLAARAGGVTGEK